MALPALSRLGVWLGARFSRPSPLAPRLFLLAALLALAVLRVASNHASAPLAPALAPLIGATPDNPPVRERAECLTALGVDRWHQLGFRGQGCKIAILDSGFRGYRDFLGKGLPANVVARTYRKDGNLEARDSQHGVLCAEVIHTLAPEAQLLLASWEPDDPASFLKAVCWAKRQGARVLSCSLIMPNWSDGEGGGQVHAALTRLLGSGQTPRDLLCFASAGNTALRHWTGSFNPDRQGLHQWGPGRTVNLLRPWGPDRIAVELYGPTKTACELQVWDEATGTLVGKMAFQADLVEHWGQAVVRFDPLAGHNYLVRLRVITHVTTGMIEQLPIPTADAAPSACREIAALARLLARRRDSASLARLNARVAALYQLSAAEFEHVLGTFPLVPRDERTMALRLLVEADWR